MGEEEGVCRVDSLVRRVGSNRPRWRSLEGLRERADGRVSKASDGNRERERERETRRSKVEVEVSRLKHCILMLERVTDWPSAVAS